MLISFDDANTHVVPILKTLLADKGWRVRQRLAESLKDISVVCFVSEMVGSSKVDVLRQEFINATSKLLKDEELEVRITCSNALPSITSLLLAPSTNGNKQTADSYYYKEIIPILKLLVNDDVQRVREAAASALPQLAVSYGKSRTTQEIIPLVKEILSNTKEDAEVKLALLTKLKLIFPLVDGSVVLDLLNTTLDPLAYSKQWRIRHALLQVILSLKDVLKTEQLNSSNIVKICLGLLGDPIAAVRLVAVDNIKQLISNFGNMWLRATLLPNVGKLAGDQNYMFRVTILLCLNIISTLCKPEDIEQSILPLFLIWLVMVFQMSDSMQ